MTLAIRPTTNQYSLQTSAHRFHQGGRDVYYFSLDLGTLDGLLPQRVEDNVVREANRRLTPSHAENIQNYLENESDWLLGALMLGIAPDALDFVPYSADNGEIIDEGFGELRIRANRINTMRIFDGQHRRRAIQDVLVNLSQPSAQDDRSAEKLRDLLVSSLTIVLYAENDITTLRQMFVDASKTKRIERHTVTRFDRRDSFNLAAIWVEENSRMFKGRVDMERSSVGRTSEYLLAVSNLPTILKAQEVGLRRRVTKDVNDRNMLALEDLYERCRVWADEFLPAAREEYEGLMSGDIGNSEIPRTRTRSFVYSAIVMRILAGAYFVWTNDGLDWRNLADFIRRASLAHGSESGLLADAGLVNPDGRTLYTRSGEVMRAMERIVTAARDAAQA